MSSQRVFEKKYKNILIRVNEVYNDSKIKPYKYDWMIYYDGAQFLDGHTEESSWKLSEDEIKSVIRMLMNFKIEKIYKQLELWDKVKGAIK